MPLFNAWDNLKESSDFKFCELRKIKLCDPLPNETIQNIAISKNIIFAAVNEALKVIVVPLVVDFEWSNKIQNEILEHYNSVVIPLSIKPRYLTICGGDGSILVVSGPLKINPDQTEIQFFDLTDLNAVNGNLKPFAIIDLVPSNAEIIGLDWHPEYNQSLFVAVLSTGSLISVGVCLAETRAGILSQLNLNQKITCVSWSPKGKQFVIGKENGEIVQMKHTDGTAFQEAKKISPDPELIGYEVNSIKWCFTQLFMVSYAKIKSELDFEVKHITVYAPPKTVPAFYNYTQLCIESFKKDLRYKTDFIHLGGVILCSTSYSSEVGVLVCDDTEKAVNSWYQLMLADDHRIELPIVRNIQALSKGIIMYYENAKEFKINDTQIIGGRNNPLMMILNSEGILCSFFVCYPKLSYPAVLQTKQLKVLNILPNQNLPLNQPALNQTNFNQSAFAANDSTQTPIKSFTNQPSTPQQQTFVQQQPNLQSNQQQLQQQKALQEQEKMIALQQQLQQQKQSAKEAELQKEKERKQIMEENHAYLIAIDEEILQFSRLVLESKEKYKRTNCLIVGKESEKRAIIDSTNTLKADLEQIKECLKGIDIELLDNFLLENFATAEDARSRAERDKDSKLTILFQKKPLDPVTQRKLKEINSRIIYIETNLKEINYILDQQWQDYILSEKGKKQNVVSPVNLVNQTLANNRRILSSLEASLRAIEPVLPWKDANHKLNYKRQDIKKLTTSLKKANLNDDLDENSYKADPDDDADLIEIHRFTRKNRINLLRLLDARPEIPIKRSSLPVDMNSTIMISAISKAKEKLKLTKKQVEKHHHHHQTVKTNTSMQQQPSFQPPVLNKKMVEQQIQQQQQQKLALSKQVPSQQVKSTATFVPPVLSQSQQQQIIQKVTGQINSNKQQQILQQQLQTNKAMPIAEKFSQPVTSKITAEPFKFSFNADQAKQPINFPQLDQTKQLQQQNAPRTTTVKTTLAQLPPLSNIFTPPNQPVEKTEFTFKPDQLNLTFDKTQLNLHSSTPIKNQQIPQQMLQKPDSTTNFKAGPLFGPNTATSPKQVVESNEGVKQTTDLTKQLEYPQKLNTSLISKYEDISPATTPTVDLKSQQPFSTDTPPKPNDPSPFSFNALANLSKMPISTTFSSSTIPTTTSNFSSPFSSPTTAFASSQPLGSLSNLQNIQNNQSNNQQQTKDSTSLLSNKPLFGQNLTTTSSTLPTTQTSIFDPNSSAFKSNATLTNLTNSPQTTVTESVTPAASSIFSMSSTADGAMNLTVTSKKDVQSSTSITQQQTSLPTVTQPQQSILTSNQQSNVQSSPVSAFSNIQTPQQKTATTMSPFTSQTVPSTQASQSFGFSMGGLGAKPNPENEKKNPFGTTPVSNASTGLLFGNPSQQPFSSLSTPNQPMSSVPAFTTSPFQSNATPGFGSFGAKPMSTASPFGSTANTSSILSKPTFGMQTTTSVFAPQTPQQTGLFQPQNTSGAFQQNTTTSGFGAKPTFGSTPSFGQQPGFGQPSGFGSPNSSFKFGSQPVFGNSMNLTNTSGSSFAQTAKTGFESFANANVPTFGSFGSPTGANTSFETIGTPQQSTGFGQPNAFGSPQPNQINPTFSGSQFNERRA